MEEQRKINQKEPTSKVVKRTSSAKEDRFYRSLRDVFVGAKVEGESGYINLMAIKSRYYENGVFPKLKQDIEGSLRPFLGFRDELFDKLYTFFSRYFSESGSIYFRYTPLHQNVYEKVSDDKDVMIFWKTRMLYYVKTDRLFKNLEILGLFDNLDESLDGWLIKSENYQALNTILPKFREKVQTIYIDPPYNTGNDEFIYGDKFKHASWISMIANRLFQARELLRDDGVIFVSVDDNEQAHLKMLMGEVMGADNFVASVAWRKRHGRNNNAKLCSDVKDFLMWYRKSDSLKIVREPRTDTSDEGYSNPDNDPRGPWTSISYVNPATKEERPNLVYGIPNPFTGKKVWHPTNAWKYSLEENQRHIRENRLYWGLKGEHRYPRLKIFLSEVGGLVPTDVWPQDEAGTTDEGSRVLENVFGYKVFTKNRVFLQDMINDIRFDNLPANWTSFDLRGFSEKKSLWDYQQKAMENAIKVLWKYYEDIRNVRNDLYHKPLLLTLVNSVNTEDADLKLLFRELERIGKGEISDDIWQRAKDELWNELKDRPSFMFEDAKIEVEYKAFQNLSQDDILECVYNSNGSGEIEILVRPSNRQELAFKLKTSDRPFALIKIGDISGWLKEELTGYEVNERFEDESYFERLNEDDSEINVLMGSRSFYEGWDSNRPNVVNFINIGTGTDAKKFILQSIGRGVRIEPLENKRKRLLPLYNTKEVDGDLFQKIKEMILPIETLFIFGTNRDALQAVIRQLDLEKEKEAWQRLSLFINDEAKKHKLLVPTYKLADQPLAQQGKPAKFPISKDERELLKRHMDFIGDERVLLAIYDTEPQKIKTLSHSLSDVDRYYKDGERSFKNLSLLFRRILNYFDVIPEEFEGLKRVFAFLYTDDESKVAEGYREYWIDKFGKALTGVLGN